MVRTRPFVALVLVAVVALAAWVEARPEAGAPALVVGAGPDLGEAQRLGVVEGFRVAGGGAALQVGLSAPAGGMAVVDRIAEIRSEKASSFWIEPGPAAGHGGAPVHLRLWTGPSAPGSDSDPGVCAVADFASGEWWGQCSGAAVWLQSTVTFTDGAGPGTQATFRFAAR